MSGNSGTDLLVNAEAAAAEICDQGGTSSAVVENDVPCQDVDKKFLSQKSDSDQLRELKLLRQMKKTYLQRISALEDEIHAQEVRTYDLWIRYKLSSIALLMQEKLNRQNTRNCFGLGLPSNLSPIRVPQSYAQFRPAVSMVLCLADKESTYIGMQIVAKRRSTFPIQRYCGPPRRATACTRTDNTTCSRILWSPDQKPHNFVYNPASLQDSGAGQPDLHSATRSYATNFIHPKRRCVVRNTPRQVLSVYPACTDPYIGCPPIIAALQAQSTHVTTLEFFTSPSLSNILESVSPLGVLRLFHTFGNIQSLSLDRATWNTLDRYEELELPQVESLCIWDSIARISQPPAFPPWKMPKLNKLKLQCALPEAASTRAFSDVHGAKITQLYLPFIPIDASSLEYIVGRCNKLAHLVLRSYTGSDFPDFSFVQNKVPYVDIVVATIRSRRLLGLLNKDISERSRKQVRLLDNSLIDNIPDLPYLFPPDEELDDDEPRIHNVFGNGASIVQTNRYICQRDSLSDRVWERRVGLYLASPGVNTSENQSDSEYDSD
ncbi:hypothetical protein PHLCEN_2v9735 [Hermanssonia centrifuga]|uniref:Uncharacterized protein n=1 Tax=Hermanssonia centrifuga TaxID=98765 RepID=A0A2R6NPW3_9APHY|nr:hypothetical protein PHLCEN_2v9735 [Hermanssonia centrifuga]